MKLTLTAVTATTLLLTAGGVRAKANLVADPGCENPAGPSGNFTQYFNGNTFGSSTQPWTVGGTDVLVIDKNYTETSGALTLAFNASSGSDALDITGAGNTGADTISQSLSLPAGQYVLLFDLGRINDDTQANAKYVGNASVGVSLGGLSLGNFVNTTESLGSVNYAHESVNFTVTTAGNFTLTFTNTTPTGNNYAGLDNIVVNAVPEPSTYVLVLGSLGLLGLGQRFRRTATRRA